MEAGPIKRRLAALLAMDAVAYSARMAEDEERTLRTLAGHRRIIDGLIASYDGRIVTTGGDSVLAEFRSSVEAVRCSVEIQQALTTRNDSLPGEERLLFRIGINLGDVIVDGNDVLGDGVNVAARLESIADPGGICISSSVYDQISGKLNLGFADMGEQSLKNIVRPVRTYRVEPADTTRSRSPGPLQSAAVRQSNAPAPARRPMMFVAAAAALAAVAVAAWMLGSRSGAPGTTTTQPKPASASDTADSAAAAGTSTPSTAASPATVAPIQVAPLSPRQPTVAAQAQGVDVPQGSSAAAPLRSNSPVRSVPPDPSGARVDAERPRDNLGSVRATEPPTSAPPVPAQQTPASYSRGTAEYRCTDEDGPAREGTVRVVNGNLLVEVGEPAAPRGFVTARGRVNDDGTVTLVVAGRGRGGGRGGRGTAMTFEGRLMNGRGIVTGPQGRCSLTLVLR